MGGKLKAAEEKAGQDEDLEDELNMFSKAAVAAHKHHWHHRHHPKKPKWGKPPKKHLHHRHVPKAGQDEDLEDELNMVSKAAVAAHKKHWHHRHHPKQPKWGKPPKKHLHHRHRPHVHVPKAGQDEDLEDKPNMAAAAKKAAAAAKKG